MARSIENIRSVPGHEGFASELARGLPEQLVIQEHPLDTQDMQRIHGQLLDWYYGALDAHFDNMLEMQLDYDFYDHIQWSEADRQVLAQRHQAPLTYNKIKLALDWIIGTERRTRIDGKVHPRAEDDVDAAVVKSELLKYISDVNRVPHERGQAFKDQVIAGVGWTNETIRVDRTEDPLEVSWVHWRQMIVDQFSRKPDLSDARFVIRRKYADQEVGEAMFPDRANIIRRSAVDHSMIGYDSEIARDMPQVWRRYDSRGYEVSSSRLIGGMASVGSAFRSRVCLFECWFRRPTSVRKIWGPGYRGVRFDRANPEHDAIATAVTSGDHYDGKIYSIATTVEEEIWCAMFTEAGLLQVCKSPFKHGKFPFTPYWCYRRDRDGMPYGIVRGVRDAQEDLNKRFSKLLWALSTNQLIYEADAMEEEDVESNKAELAKPNGTIKLKAGGLGKIRIERNLDVAEAQIKLIELDAAHVHDGSGVNREQLGRETNAASGRAILAKQQEGAVATGEPFDNYRLGIQLSGQKQLSLMEQFYTEQRQFRIIGERKGLEWRRINEPFFDDQTGEWAFSNDITKSVADYVVDQQDFRESMRQAYAEQLMEMLSKFPPEMAMQMLDLVVEMTDVPMRDALVKRIRAINGQTDPDSDEESPEAIARRDQTQQDQALALRERLAKVGLDEAKTAEIAAKAQTASLGSRKHALEIAELIDLLLPLAPAADRLLSTTSPPPQADQPQEALVNA